LRFRLALLGEEARYWAGRALRVGLETYSICVSQALHCSVVRKQYEHCAMVNLVLLD
jgi:hypothetical protein